MTNITAFPIFNVDNIPESLRLLAARIEDPNSEESATTCIVILKCSDGSLDSRVFGALVEKYEAMGMCNYVAQEIFESTNVSINHDN